MRKMRKVKKPYKLLSYILAISISSAFPAFAADSNSYNESSYQKHDSNVIVSDNGIIINKVFYTPTQFEALLETAQLQTTPPQNTYSPFSSFFALPPYIIAAAGTYLIPGVGEIEITTTGIVLIAGVTIGASTWAAKKIISYFSEHTSKKRPSTHDKHTKPRPGRDSEKKKDSKKGWKPRNPKSHH